MAEFLQALSPDSIAFRFFGSVDLDWVADWSTDVDYDDRYALVATTGPGRRWSRHGAYVRTGADRAEVAFAVADEWQGYGIATIMLAHLAAGGRGSRDRRLHRQVLPRQPPHDRGVPRQRVPGHAAHAGTGSSRSSCRPRFRSRARERFEQREQTAAIAAVESFLRPRSVAVIGASRGRGHGRAASCCTTSSPAASRARSTRSTARGRSRRGCAPIASIGEVPEPVDLAVIAVPAAHVGRGGARMRAARASRALLVISAGFAEIGRRGRAPPAGAARRMPRGRHAPDRAQLPRRAQHRSGGAAQRDVRRAGAAAGRVDRLPVPERRPRASRSIEAAEALRLGLSSFVSVGNKAGHLGQRPARVLGARPRDQRRAAVPRVVRQPAALRAARSPGRAHQADRRRQERPLAGGRPRHRLPHGRPAPPRT